MKHDDLTQYYADDRDDSDAKLECYFDDYTMNLWHVYVNGSDIFNLLSDTVIESLEREYANYLLKEIKERSLSLAISEYESRELDRKMGI